MTQVAALTLIEIPDLGLASALDGTEQVPIDQAGVTRQTTTADIAALAGSLTISWTAQVDVALASGQTDNWGPTLTGITRVRADLAGDASVTGLVGGTDGRVIFIQNVDAVFTLTLLVENAGSTGLNRFLANGDVLLPPGCGALFMYDGGLQRWIKT